MILKLGHFFLFAAIVLNLNSAAGASLCQSHFNGSVTGFYYNYDSEFAARYYSSQVHSFNELRLFNSDDQMVTMPSSNAYFTPDGLVRSQYSDLVYEMISRTPEEQQAYDQMLTEWHGGNEMTFRRKNKVTGHYDVVVDVPVQSAFMPIRKAHYDKVVQSTGPVLQEFRRILQIYSSRENATIEDLELEGLSEIEKKEYLETLNNSIYMVDKLIHPNMEEYPFLPVTGVDVALGKLEEELAQFFEFNMGTPSGLSNLIQLIEGLRINDPKQFETVRRFMRKDRTFEILRKVIDESGLYWTNQSDGISVIVGPGSGNGAHPDVAMISYLTGMPLVDGKDLYVDRDGFLRLNTGAENDHPKVTGIYSRAEESFIMQNDEDGIGLVIPSNQEVNERLNRELGLELEGAKTYLYKTEKRKNAEGDDEDYIVDVYRDDSGKPMLSQYLDQIGIDPNRPNEPAGSLAEAVVNRKVFLSNVLGRIVDDKGLFDMTSKLAQIKVGNPDLVAKPPATLDPSQGYQEFFDYPQGYVAKIKDESGGNGVNIMVNLNQAETADVVELVRNNPRDYIVQGFVQFALANQVELSPEGVYRWGTRANDWRIFVCFFPDGRVDAGDASILIRGANVGSASTNTSQNGTYIVGGPLYDTPSDEVKADESLIVPFQYISHMGLTKQTYLREFLQQLSQTHQALTTQNEVNLLSLQYQAKEMARLQREVMPFFNFEHSSFMSLNRKFGDGEIDFEPYKETLIQFVESLKNSKFYFTNMSDFIERFFRPGAGLTQKEQKERRLPPGQPELVELVTKKALVGKQRRVVESQVNGPYDKVEVAKYRYIGRETAKSDRGFALINEIIEALNEYNGELRQTELVHSLTGESLEGAHGAAYFRVDEKGRPIIGINLSQPMVTSGLVHEFGHFKRWRKLYEQELALLKAGGFKGSAQKLRIEAAREANRQLKFPRARFLDEMNSTELEFLEDHKSIAEPSGLNTNNFMVPSYLPTHKDYIERVLYAYSEGIKSGLIIMAQGKIDEKELSESELLQVEKETSDLMFEGIHAALSRRKESIIELTADYEAATKAGEQREAEILSERLIELAQVKVFDLLYPRGSINRISGTGLNDELLSLFERAWMRIPLDRYFIYETDREVLGRGQVDYARDRMWVHIQSQQ